MPNSFWNGTGAVLPLHSIETFSAAAVKQRGHGVGLQQRGNSLQRALCEARLHLTAASQTARRACVGNMPQMRSSAFRVPRAEPVRLDALTDLDAAESVSTRSL